MAQDIAPGDTVKITVKHRPTSDAARKTLVRVLSKDPAVVRENDRLRRVRAANERTKQRGGRQWHVRVPKQHPVAGERGDAGTVHATSDVVRDLHSVRRFVDVVKA
ncbi:MAG: hypothetical protein WD009_10070 [Phycisphaeraceae bacterium]